MKIDDRITVEPKWDKTPKDVWNERFAALTDDDDDENQADSAVAKTVSIAAWTKRIISVAAALLLLLSATTYLYTKDTKSVAGKTVAVTLPDGSLAQLSSASEISYRPLLWLLSVHDVTLKGEAYFSGHHADGFTVKTDNGEVNVLGTSFNVRTFDNRLQVACINGRVKVSTHQSSVVLTAGMETAAQEEGQLTTQHFTDVESITGWTHGVFSFYDCPLTDVLRDVERNYGVTIEASTDIDTLRYTGRFTRNKPVESVLAIIGQSYNISFKIAK
jgi:transmembrane sensor